MATRRRESQQVLTSPSYLSTHIDSLVCYSVRLSSKTQYNTGLFILDLDQAPWGCGMSILVVDEVFFASFLDKLFGPRGGR